MRGRSPLTPILQFSLKKSSTSFMLHGARVDETPSARGSIAIESRRWVRISHENYHRLRFQIFYMTLAMPAATPAGLPVWRPQFSLFLKCPHNSSSFQRGTY